MNRRDFLTRAVPATTLPFLMHGFALQAYGRSPLLDGSAFRARSLGSGCLSESLLTPVRVRIPRMRPPPCAFCAAAPRPAPAPRAAPARPVESAQIGRAHV